MHSRWWAALTLWSSRVLWGTGHGGRWPMPARRWRAQPARTGLLDLHIDGGPAFLRDLQPRAFAAQGGEGDPAATTPLPPVLRWPLGGGLCARAQRPGDPGPASIWGWRVASPCRRLKDDGKPARSWATAPRKPEVLMPGLRSRRASVRCCRCWPPVVEQGRSRARTAPSAWDNVKDHVVAIPARWVPFPRACRRWRCCRSQTATESIVRSTASGVAGAVSGGRSRWGPHRRP